MKTPKKLALPKNNPPRQNVGIRVTLVELRNWIAAMNLVGDRSITAFIVRECNAGAKRILRKMG